VIYLDSAATSLQKPPAVARACSYAISHYASPGRGGHKPAMDAAAAAFACREAAARLFQVPKLEQVVFTNNATHGLNIAIKALVRPGGTVVISGYEHNAVTRPLHAIPDVTVRVAAGQLFRPEETVEAFRKALTPEVTAAVFTHVSNVFGMILPIQELARLEGILLDPVYTGKAWSGMLKLLQEGGLGGRGDILFIHTGGAAALFAMDLA